MGSIIILLTATMAVSAVVTSNVDAGLVGMVLSYALNTTGALVSQVLVRVWDCRTEKKKNWLVRLASDVEQNVVSVERITHYANDLPLEAPRELMDRKPPDWVAWGWSSRVQVGLGGRAFGWAN